MIPFPSIRPTQIDGYALTCPADGTTLKAETPGQLRNRYYLHSIARDHAKVDFSAAPKPPRAKAQGKRPYPSGRRLPKPDSKKVWKKATRAYKHHKATSSAKNPHPREPNLLPAPTVSSLDDRQ